MTNDDNGAVRLGFGVSGPHAAKWFPERDVHALVRDAYEGGIRHFDCAPFYGAGEAERRLGDALAALGAEDARISSKTGTRRQGRKLIKDFSERAIRQDVEASLTRLRRARLDLLYLHGPSIEELGRAQPILDRLREEGLISAYGVCGEGESLRTAVARQFGAVMGRYNLVDKQHAEVFAAAKAVGVTTTAIAPLAQALYDRRYYHPRSLSDLWRIARSVYRRGPETSRRMSLARSALEAIDDRTPTQAALGFVMANRNVDIVMTTTSHREHLADLIAAAKMPLRPPDLAILEKAHLDPAPACA
jgi:D-threo-aldose 1-dehydrogenase